MVEWTKEKIEVFSDKEIETLRGNATKIGRQDIVDLCNEELTRRRPARIKKVAHGTNEDRRNLYVCEFHFVCATELNVTRNQDGTIWTGTWVVAEEHAKRALQYGALVALHTSKAEPSYLQGLVKDWRKRPRLSQYASDQMTQTEEGIDFLFQSSETPMQWKGDGTGEKGYGWAPLPK